jgi:hypothetical protein
MLEVVQPTTPTISRMVPTCVHSDFLLFGRTLPRTLPLFACNLVQEVLGATVWTAPTARAVRARIYSVFQYNYLCRPVGINLRRGLMKMLEKTRGADGRVGTADSWEIGQ